MRKYIGGEIYRVLHKRGLYILLFIYFALSAVMIAVANAMLDDVESLLSGVEALFSLMPFVIGGYLFSSFYCDDLSAKNLPTLIGFGIRRRTIVLSKLLLTLLFAGVFCVLFPLFVTAVLLLLGVAEPALLFEFAAQGFSALSVKALMEILGYVSVAAIVVYGLQRPTISVVAFLLIAMGVVGQLIGTVLNLNAVTRVAPGLSNHQLSMITIRVLTGMMEGGPVAAPLLEFVVYIAVATTLTILAFRAKELEF